MKVQLLIFLASFCQRAIAVVLRSLSLSPPSLTASSAAILPSISLSPLSSTASSPAALSTTAAGEWIASMISRNSSDIASGSSVSCSNKNLSAGSAFFILAGLALCCVAHPRGSLAFKSSGRVWRLAPLFVFVEALTIICASVEGLRKGYSWHVVCSTILAVRTGNTLPTSVYDEVKEELIDELVEQAQAAAAARDGDIAITVIQAQPSGSHDGPVLLPQGRTNTIELEEGRLSEVTRRRGFQADPPAESHEEDVVKPTLQQLVDEHRQLMDAILKRVEQERRADALLKNKMFQRQLEEVSRLEKGLSYRIFVWFPALLLFIKLASVLGGWNPFTGPKVFGIMYIIGWFAVELVLVISGHTSLTADQHTEALALGQLWQKEVEREKIRSFFEWDWIVCDKLDSSFFTCGAYAVWIQTAFNLWVPISYSTEFIFKPAIFFFSRIPNYTDKGPMLHVLLSPIELLPAFIGFYAQLIFLVVYIGLILALASPMVPAIFFRSLTTFVSETSWVGDSLHRIAYEAIPINNKYMVPSFVALSTAGISLARYAGYLNDYWRYDCRNTALPSWYDWLG